MKKMLLIVAVAALALTLVPLAIADAPGGGGWKHGKAKFNLVGKVTNVAAESGVITVYVKAGTKSVRTIRHADAEMGFADGAKIVWIGKGGNRQLIGLDQLENIQVGARVKVRGVVAWAGDASPELVVTIKHMKVRQAAPVVEPTTPPTE